MDWTRDSKPFKTSKFHTLSYLETYLVDIPTDCYDYMCRLEIYCEPSGKRLELNVDTWDRWEPDNFWTIAIAVAISSFLVITGIGVYCAFRRRDSSSTARDDAPAAPKEARGD